MPAPAPTRSTGRALPYPRGVLLVIEHSWTWYRRNWRATVVSSVLQPLLFLLAFGIGFGSLVGDTGATGGVPYLVWLAPALLAAVLTGSAVAALIAAYAATVENEGAAFSSVFRFVVVPMTLFSGTFFPVDRLPEWVQPLARVSPLWHGTVLARDAALGVWRPLPALGHTAYLVALLMVGLVLVTRLFTRRLTR